MPFTFPELLAAAAIAAAPQFAFARYFAKARPDDASIAASRRREVGLVDHVFCEELVAPDTMLTTYGALGAMYELRWRDTSVMSDVEAMEHDAWKNKALRRLGGSSNGWMAQNYVLPEELGSLPMPDYVVGDGHRVLSESHVEYASGNRFRWRYFTAFTYQPPEALNARVSGLVFSGEKPVEASPEKVAATFEEGLRSVEGDLRVAGTPRRLGTHPLDAGRSEFLEAIYHVVFGERQAIAQPNPFEPFPVGGMLASRELPRGGITPMVGDKHLRVLSVFNLPKDTQPNMMEAFLTSAVAGSVYAQRMIFQDVRSAKSKIDFARRSQKGKNAGKGGGKAVDRYAQILEGKAEDALLAADVGDIVYTHYSAKVVFLNRDLEALLAGLDVVKRAFEAKGFTVNTETVNTLDGWFGMWPFNGFHDVREGQVHTMNAARMWPSSSRWAGRQTWTCKQCGPETVPALTGTTATGEPFYFDPHGPDSEQNFVQFGSPGVGKTTDLNAIAASYRRRPTDAVRAIDKNRGQLVTCKFLGGSYHDDEKYWLFGDLERQEKRWKVAKFLTNLGAIGGVEIGFEQRNDVQRTLELMLEYPAAHRSLSTFVNLLAPIDREGAFAKTLAQYQEGGVYRGRFDGVAPIETNADDSYEVHEMGALLGAKQDAEVAGPVMMWLLNSFEDKLPGRRTLIPWEEAWTSIHGVVASLIEELLRTIRYRHGGIGFFTHNLAEIKDSPIGKIVFATCPTRVIYPNRDAAGEFREFFEGLELSPSQIDAVKNGEAKKVKFLSVEGKFGAFSRTYSPAELAIYGCTGYDEVAAARRLIEEHPDDWDERQLRAYGCDREADRLRSLRRQRITHADARREALIR